MMTIFVFRTSIPHTASLCERDRRNGLGLGRLFSLKTGEGVVSGRNAVAVPVQNKFCSMNFELIQKSPGSDSGR
jgi:hypothetical protein